ncbi:Rhodanese-related sulfurtransferase [Massilia sp. CF038]|nr:Rhodanese-related sulfurtransferase [Massilia sp. CF038]
MRGLPCLKPLTIGTCVKFILDNILLVSIVILSGGALLIPALIPRGKRASTLEVTQLLNRGKNVLVDVRTTEEFAAGHLRDAKHIPLADLTSRIGELDKFKDKTVIVVCQTGARSDKAMNLLKAAGFTDVVALDGGIAAWQAANLPTVK